MDPLLESLVEANLPQARLIARQAYATAPYALELAELQSLAYTGLMMAATRWHRYCEERGFDPGATQYFSAYAARRMRGAILDAMRANDWVTRSLRSRARRLRDAGQDLGKTEEELAEATGLTPGQVRSTLAGMAQRPVSLDAEVLDVPEEGDVEEQVLARGILREVVAAMSSLPLEQQVILVLHYYSGMELREIAADLGMSEAQVSRAHVDGILAVHTVMLREATARTS